jgi:hypothetical protein
MKAPTRPSTTKTAPTKELPKSKIATKYDKEEHKALIKGGVSSSVSIIKPSSLKEKENLEQ